MTISELWNNFQTEISNRLLISVPSGTDFYLSPEFNLKLFKILFNVDTELIKEQIQSENKKLPSRSSLTAYFLDVTYAQIEQVISYGQQRLLHASLQKIVIESFQHQLKGIYYTPEDFNNPGILIIPNAKTVKYSDYNDESISIFVEQVSTCIEKFKIFITESKAKCSLTDSFPNCKEEIKITRLKSDCDLHEYANTLNMHFQHFCSDLSCKIQNAKQSLTERIPNITLRQYYFQMLDDFYDYVSTKWCNAYEEHIKKLKYNDSLAKHTRRNEKMIRQNSDSFYPIKEYIDSTQEQLGKVYKRIAKKTTKEPAPTPAASKQEQINSLCLQTLELIDQYTHLTASLSQSTPFLACSAESLFSYLSEQHYFDID